MPRITSTHGYISLGGATLAMVVQVGIAEGMATKSYQLAHHAKQFVAIIPKLVSDFACIVLLGPSSRAVASRQFFSCGLVCIVLVHGAKTHTTTRHYVATGSAEALTSMIQAASCLALHLIMFFLHRPCGISAWACYRATHVLVGASSIFLCIHLRLCAESSRIEFPPLRGSFEGAILAYAYFIAFTLWLAPNRRLWVHSGLCDIIPWLPLGALKRNELTELLKAEDVPNSAEARIPRRRRLVGRWPSEQSVSDGGEFFGLLGQHCGASTVGSNSEVADLSSFMQPALPQGQGPAEVRLPTPDAFYRRERALEHTLQALGITFPAEDEQDRPSGSQSCASSCSGS